MCAPLISISILYHQNIVSSIRTIIKVIDTVHKIPILLSSCDLA